MDYKAYMKKYLEVKTKIDNGMNHDQAAQESGYSDRKGFQKARERLKSAGYLNSEGALTDKAQELIDTSNKVVDIPQNVVKTVSKELQKTTNNTKKRERRYQVYLSEPVSQFLEAECDLENIKVVQKISQICTEYYRKKQTTM